MFDKSQDVEQDEQTTPGGGELPAYDDLAQQHGPNSRFGRWKGWIEKRAAERYSDITPEELQRRRERGWDLEPGPRVPKSSVPRIVTSALPELHVQTDALSLQDNAGPELKRPRSTASPPPFITQVIHPSHLKLSHFGSRFLPHSTSQIRCILPLNSDRLLLIGHDEGLSVLDMFPQEWSETGGIDVKTPDEAQARPIWEGEGVFQMSIIEQREGVDGNTQGVVLALVGPEYGLPASKDGEMIRTLRMYNLHSLINLAKWTIARKGTLPLDMRRSPTYKTQVSSAKKHWNQASISNIARGLKSPEQHPVSFQNMLGSTVQTSLLDRHTNTMSSNQQSPTSSRQSTDYSGCNVVDDLPLLWAADFVPLATPNSRLAGTPVISYAIWTEENRLGRRGQLLAVVIKCNILLYEVPKGERVFRFVKEFYTPTQPRNIAFFQQIVQKASRSLSDVAGSSATWHRHAESTSTVRDVIPRSSPSGSSAPLINYGPQLSLFVVFDKKAGWIRIADSAVGEIELPDDSYVSALNQDPGSSQFLNPRDSPIVTANVHRVRARLSFEYASTPKWILPVRCELPVPGPSTGIMPTETTRDVIFLTRERKTHIFPWPLPSNYATYPSLAIIPWKSSPRHISPRLCERNLTDAPPFLQLVAFGEDGLEVQEISLNFMSRGKGKGKMTYEEVVRAEDDVIGECGFLATGGHWDQINRLMDSSSPTTRMESTSSNTSSGSCDSVDTLVMVSWRRRQEGLYGWWKKSGGDFRIFWVGGSL